MIRHIVLPGALPAALTGLQLSVVFSLIALVVGEQINATSGLGFMITQAEQFLQPGDPGKIQMIRRFIQHHDVRRLHQRLRHGEPIGQLRIGLVPRVAIAAQARQRHVLSATL